MGGIQRKQRNGCNLGFSFFVCVCVAQARMLPLCHSQPHSAGMLPAAKDVLLNEPLSAAILAGWLACSSYLASSLAPS